MASQLALTSLFGGDRPWSPLEWTSQDDTVRNGSSHSALSINPASTSAEFCGYLDIKTLGGAGFASQRTTGDDRVWDLSPYDAVLLNISASDAKQYAFILKDEILPPDSAGREQSTISWEYAFRPKEAGGTILIPWNELKPTYRGRDVPGAKPLDLTRIKRFSLMMRSFFGTQEGHFSLTINSISAVENPKKLNTRNERNRDDLNEPGPSDDDSSGNSNLRRDEMSGEQKGWLAWIFRG